MTTISFSKYSGNGNDFVILDHPEHDITPILVQRLCDRHFGVGADGVLVLGNSSSADARMQIFNADGGEAEMCANGLRCLATYFDSTQTLKKDTYTIQTMNAVYPVTRKDAAFALEMSEIKDKNIYDLTPFKAFLNTFYINTGVPHLVLQTKNLKAIDVKRTGSEFRHHTIFPKGANVNFVEVDKEKNQTAIVRTYERGVEDETFSCGTGLTATALALSEWLGWRGNISLLTKGGKQQVSVGEKVFYSGEVTFCFSGEISL
jgi:diaminopimelate epimerase